jgi:hypothetical protein
MFCIFCFYCDALLLYHLSTRRTLVPWCLGFAGRRRIHQDFSHQALMRDVSPDHRALVQPPTFINNHDNWRVFMRMSGRELWVPRHQMSTSKVPMVCESQKCPITSFSNIVIRIVDQRCNCRYQSSQASSSNWTCFWCARRAR